jgi:hypothetical protein
MPNETDVSVGEVLAEERARSPVQVGTFLQRTGLTLAVYVGALSCIVTLTLIFGWMRVSPNVPVIPSGTDPNTVKTIVENYRSLQQVTLEPFTTLLDSIVAKILLPIFTSILGYIFGSRSNDR